MVKEFFSQLKKLKGYNEKDNLERRTTMREEEKKESLGDGYPERNGNGRVTIPTGTTITEEEEKKALSPDLRGTPIEEIIEKLKGL